MIFTVRELELFLRVMVMRAGGTAVFMPHSSEITNIDEILLFAEATPEGDGVKLTTVRVDEEHAGHA